MQIQEAFLPTLKINSLSSGAHPAKCGQSSSHPDDMKSPNGTSNGVIVLIPHHSVTVTTLCPLKYPESFGLFCNGERCGRQSFLGRTLKRRGQWECWQRTCYILKPAAPLTVKTVSKGVGKKGSRSPWWGDWYKKDKRESRLNHRKSERKLNTEQRCQKELHLSLVPGQTQIPIFVPISCSSQRPRCPFTHSFNIFWWNT